MKGKILFHLAKYTAPSLLLLLLISCHQKSETEAFADSQYEKFQELIAKNREDYTATTPAQFVAESHYDAAKRKEAAQWLSEYNHKLDENRTVVKADEAVLDRRFDSLGKLTVISEHEAKKCNLYEGYYVLNHPVRDSAALAFLADYTADKLFQSAKKDPGCTYPVMAQVFIYASASDYQKDVVNYVSTCSITPSSYGGEIWVNKPNVKKFIR